MGGIRYGRHNGHPDTRSGNRVPISGEGEQRQKQKTTEKEENQRAAMWVLVLGSVMVALFLISTAEVFPIAEKTVYEGVAAVMSTGVIDEMVQDGERVGKDNPASLNTAGEGMGMLEGEWNLWEYLGDLFSALLIP